MVSKTKIMTSEQPKVEGVSEAQAKVAELASKMKSINNIDIEALKRMKMMQVSSFLP